MAAWVKRHWAALAVIAILAASTATIRLEGRIWFCECWQLRFIIADAWNPHTSQHSLDPYSLTHFQHGLVFYWLLVWLAPRASWQTRLVASTAIEALWEVVENSSWVIDRYRDATAALGYTGDSVVNSIGDIACCVIGFAVARRLGRWGSAATFMGIEALLVLAIRDSLLLNVLMLFFPLEAVKQWQMGH